MSLYSDLQTYLQVIQHYFNIFDIYNSWLVTKAGNHGLSFVRRLSASAPQLRSLPRWAFDVMWMLCGCLKFQSFRQVSEIWVLYDLIVFDLEVPEMYGRMMSKKIEGSIVRFHSECAFVH